MDGLKIKKPKKLSQESDVVGYMNGERRDSCIGPFQCLPQLSL